MIIADSDTEVAPHATSRLQEGVSRRYLGVLLFVALICYLFPFVAQRVKPLRPLLGTFYGGILEGGFHLQSQNADVVLFGDSSALYGVDVKRLSSELHEKAINIPNTRGSFPVTREDALRLYLQTNRAPRVIVFVLAPWDLNIGNERNAQMFEGEEILLEHGSLHRIREFARSFPLEILQFPFRFYQGDDIMLRVIHSQPHHPAPLVQGHLDYDWGTKPGAQAHPVLGAGCSLPQSLLQQKSDDYARELRSTFATAGTQTMVYISPIPRCSQSEVLAGRSYATVSAAPPLVLAPGDFADDRNFVHVVPSSEAPVTDALAQAIERLRGSR